MNGFPKIDYSRTLPVMVEADVMVCGGGAAGVAAAVAARTAGASVFLAAGFTCFGGLGTAARVPSFCQWGDGVRVLAGGFGWRFRERLRKAGGLYGAEGAPDWMIAVDFEVAKREYDRVMQDSGADFLFQTRVIDVIMDGDSIKYVVVAAPSGVWAAKAKVFVDATGNGDVACCAGVPFEKGDDAGRMMPASLLSSWDGVDWGRWEKEKSSGGFSPFGMELDRAIKDGVFKEPDLHMTGLFRHPGNYATANIGHVFNLDGTDERSLTRGFVRGRELTQEHLRYFREYLKRGLENIRLVETAAMMGVRETRRILGDYVLGIADYRRRAVFEDEIGRYCYQIDIHPSSGDKAEYENYLKEFGSLCYGRGESYGIPYRILCAKGVKNLLVAGRCVSADKKVQSSIRVMPGCYITGQAAGFAAAAAVDSGSCDIHAVNVKALQQALKAFGAYLPNA